MRAVTGKENKRGVTGATFIHARGMHIRVHGGNKAIRGKYKENVGKKAETILLSTAMMVDGRQMR